MPERQSIPIYWFDVIGDDNQYADDWDPSGWEPLNIYILAAWDINRFWQCNDYDCLNLPSETSCACMMKEDNLILEKFQNEIIGGAGSLGSPFHAMNGNMTDRM